MLRLINSILLATCVLLQSGHSSTAEVKRTKFNNVLKLGQSAPDWKDLPGVDGKKHSLSDYSNSKVLVLIFMCNHCPCAKGYEQRLIDFTNKYKDQGVQLVAINCNRTKADQLEAMRERAEAGKFPYAYVRDDSQQTGRQYGATTTPQVFILDQGRKAVYMGAFDDQNDAALVKKRFAEDAVTALLAGQEPTVKESRPRGCAINYE